MKLWIFNCREISRLVSESMDRELRWWQKAGIRFHNMMCTYCARFSRQLHEIRALMALHQDRTGPQKMDEEVKQRIKSMLRSGKS